MSTITKEDLLKEFNLDNLTEEELEKVSGGTQLNYKAVSELIRTGQEEFAREQFESFVRNGFLDQDEMEKLRFEFWLKFGYDIDS